jgi:hypothetical protein
MKHVLIGADAVNERANKRDSNHIAFFWLCGGSVRVLGVTKSCSRRGIASYLLHNPDKVLSRPGALEDDKAI